MVKNKDDHHAGGISRRQTRIKTMTTTTEMSEDQMQTIHLTDTAARIASIEHNHTCALAALEWGGPDDRDISDFDLPQLGAILNRGMERMRARAGWVLLAGPCSLNVGDSIPLSPA